ncbi:MAG: hypothetical protein LBK99_01910 [Opitutaceae bacterium]|jgi:hypothetical protein|nr:hypothetical protein [Opitutaceae bacterium]
MPNEPAALSDHSLIVETDDTPAAHFAAIDRHLADIEKCLADIRAIKRLQFADTEQLVRDGIAGAIEHGKHLRALLESTARRANVPVPDWQNADELKAHFVQLDALAEKTSRAETLRARLRSIIDVLESITDFGIKAARRRADAERARATAIAELNKCQEQDAPPELSGDGDGREWFRSTLALPAASLETLLEHLRGSMLPSLANLLEELDNGWERVRFSSPVAAVVAISPLPVSPSVSPSVSAGQIPPAPDATPNVAPETPDQSQPVSGKTDTPRAWSPQPEPASVPPPPAAAPASIPCPDVPTTNAVPADPVDSRTMPRPLPDSLPPSTPVQPPIVSAAPAPAASPAMSGATLTCDADLLTLFTGKPDAERLLVPDLVAHLPEEERSLLMPHGLWQALVWQPWLRNPDDKLADQLRTCFRDVADGGWMPQTQHDTLLAWSALFLPALIDFAPEATALFRAIPVPQLPEALKDPTRLTLEFLNSVNYCSPDIIRGGASVAEWNNGLHKRQQGISRACELARNQRIIGFKAWKQLNRNGGYLHSLSLKMQGAPSSWPKEIIRQMIAELQDRTRATRLVDRMTRESGSGHLAPLEARPLDQLLHHIAEFAKECEELLRYAEKKPTGDQHTIARVGRLKEDMIPRLKEAEAPGVLEKQSVSHTSGCLPQLAHKASLAAIREILSLFDTTTPWESRNHDAFLCRHLARLCTPGLLLYSDTKDMASAPSETRIRLEAMARTGHMDTLNDAFEKRCRSGDIGNARIILNALSSELSSDQREQAEVRLDQEAARARKTVADALRKARHAVTNARILLVMADSVADEKIHELTDIEKRRDETEDYHLQQKQIQSILDGIRLDTEKEAEKLRTDINGLPHPMPENEKQRLFSLIRSGDLATAREYLNRVAKGQPLPTLPCDETENHPARYIENLSGAYQSDNGFRGLQTAVRGRARYAGMEFAAQTPEQHETTRHLLDVWSELRATHQPMRSEPVDAFLHDIGFAVSHVAVRQEGGNLSIARVETAPTIDRDICPIPQFGSSAAGRMLLVRPAGNQQPEQLASLFRDQKLQRQDGDIVIFLLSGRFEQRPAFARLCRAKEIRALIIDDLIVAHLLGNPNRRLAHFFQITIPWTWANPFVPTTSFVPPEMFFGRREALASLTNYDEQRCFVFGGRQLGKSALLREVERRAHQPANEQYSIWIDLLAAGFGSRSEPAEIWRTLEERFKQLPSFADSLSAIEASSHLTGGRIRKPADRPGAGTRIEEAVIHWLNTRSERRLLLLLDEGDRFLERDSAHDFAEARILKSIMDRTQRHFKVVFAGLHNVQRTTRQINHPLAHLGDPINIGAFTEQDEWMEAWSMLVVPLAGLGYHFETPDLPSRILSYCNFYPSMLQQFGSRLLMRLRQRSQETPPFTITETDIEEISRDENFRQFMVERFHWTLQLDARYHYLAYTFADLFHEKPRDAIPGFTAVQLREEAAGAQPEIFAHLTLDDTINLLNEMIGLGILRPLSGNRYGLRNTNVLLLLGTRDEILTRLTEAMPDAKSEYDPGSFRPHLPSTKSASTIERRLLARPEEDRLAKPAHEFFLASGNDLFDASNYPRWKTSLQGSIPKCIIQRLPYKNEKALGDALDRQADAIREEGTYIFVVQSEYPKCNLAPAMLEAAENFTRTRKSPKRFFKVVFIVPPGCLWKTVPKADGTHINPWLHNPNGPRQWIFPRRWEREFVEPWLQELSQPVPAGGFNQLLETTGCWPCYLYPFAQKLCQPYSSWEEAITHTRSLVETDLARPHPKVMNMFMGCGPEVDEALNAFRSLRGDAQNALPFGAEDIDALSEIIDTSRSRIDHWIRVATLLGLVESRGDRFLWEPLFDHALSLLSPT